jgi:hypothetical protein
VAIKTTLEQIEEVQAAITAVMSGQSYAIGGRSVTKANLDALSKREEALLARYYRETGTPGSAINIGTLRRED